MTSSESPRLNFYSKYNRVQNRQDIDSLYALIDHPEPPDDLVLTLNCSRAILPDDSRPPRRRGQGAGQPQETPRDEAEAERGREVEEKLRQLERMDREFHQQMERTEREQRKKQEQRDAKRRAREDYRLQLINVVEHTSEHSHHDPLPNTHAPPPPAPVAAEDFEDEYYGREELPLREENEMDVRETRRKLKEIIEMQRRREREVESVEENNDVKTSIVIERLTINPKKPRDTHNYCEVELAHSRSANILRTNSHHQLDPPAHQHQPNQDHLEHYPQLPHYEEVNLNDEDAQESQQEEHESQEEVEEQEEEAEAEEEMEAHNSQSEQQHEEELEGEEIEEKEEEEAAEASQCFESEYDHSQGVEGPLTLEGKPGTVQDGSELSEEIADHVVSIGDLSEQQSQPPAQAGHHRGPLFFSQAHPRHSFHSQHEVQSIAESIDYHPLDPPGPRHATSRILYDAEPDRKTSFKKLMAENRANLIPRLAISTILNEHINEALGDYRHPHPPTPPPAPAPAALHESIISSEGSVGRPGKVNFKSVLRRSKPAVRAEVKPRDPVKAQANKSLLLGFFDEN